MKEVYKVYLHSGRAVFVVVDPKPFDNMRISEKKTAIVSMLNERFGAELVKSVHFEYLFYMSDTYNS